MAHAAAVGRRRFGAVPARRPGRHAGGGDPAARRPGFAGGTELRGAEHGRQDATAQLPPVAARPMTIKFVCSCGKRLKARDEMASRRTPCPRCGALVGVPALRTSDPNGEAIPDLPRPAAATTLDVQAIETAIVQLLPRKSETRRKRPARHLEQHWHECLRYPLQAWPVYVLLAMLMTALSAAVTWLAPWMVADPPTSLW